VPPLRHLTQNVNPIAATPEKFTGAKCKSCAALWN
jgi:hypothetical protein